MALVNTNDHPSTGWLRIGLAILTTLLASFAAVWISVKVGGYQLLERYPLDFSGIGLTRTLLCFISGGTAAWAVVLAFPHERLGKATWSSSRLDTIVPLVSIALLYGSAALFAFAPEQLLWLVSELGPIAIAQEALLLLGVGAVGVAAYRSRGQDRTSIFGVPGTLVILGMALAILILFLEEISYGQHYIGWATPALFDGNIQSETNFHNFHTYRFELAYYAAAVIAFIVLPLSRDHLPAFLPANLRNYLPSPYFAVAALPVCIYLHQAWNSVPFQILFFFGCFLALLLSMRMDKNARYDRALCQIVLAGMLLCQAFALLSGARMLFTYEAAEMRELHISMMIAFYGVWLAGRVSALCRPDNRVI